jgi:hypothetical protein
MSSERDAAEYALRDAAHDAFMAFWRGEEADQPALWAADCLAQARYDASHAATVMPQPRLGA